MPRAEVCVTTSSIRSRVLLRKVTASVNGVAGSPIAVADANHSKLIPFETAVAANFPL